MLSLFPSTFHFTSKQEVEHFLKKEICMVDLILFYHIFQDLQHKQT